MTNAAVVFVPYRPIWYYERLGPCVRDWAMIEAASALCNLAGVPAWIIDRPMFMPWRRTHLRDTTSYRSIADLLPTGQIVAQCQVPLVAALLHGRRASAPYIEQSLRKLKREYDSLLVLDFDPFGEFAAPSGAQHWFDEIDDFSKHRRIPKRDRLAFLKKRLSPHAIHTASSLESIEGVAVPNWMFTPVTPDNSSDRFPYEFGYIGYVDNKLDIDLVARLAERGPVGIWGKILDRDIHRRLAATTGVDLMGEYDTTQLQEIIGQFRVGTIPFLVDRIHGNSPIKYYQYSAAHKSCLSTSTFGLERENLVVLDDPRSDTELDRAISTLPAREDVDWDRVERENNEGKKEFESLFSAALKDLQ